MIRFGFVVLIFSVCLMACNRAQNTKMEVDSTSSLPEKEMTNQKYNPSESETIEKIVKAEEEWKKELNQQEFYVLREAGTERAFSGEFWDNKEEGIYTCGGCGLQLFDSNTKFKSGTGWPSFYEPIDSKFVAEKADVSFGMRRVEVICARCDGHLGHVFDDGPKPTGLRYCMNSLSLDFVSKEQLDN